MTQSIHCYEFKKVVMSKNILLFYFFTFIAYSCSNDDPEVDKIKPLSAGKYLSEISITGNAWHVNPKDTFKYITLEYDENRYLKKMYRYNHEFGYSEFLNEYFYDNTGQIIRIDVYTLGANSIKKELFQQEIFTYKDHKLITRELFDLEFGNIMVNKSQYSTDSVGHVTQIVESYKDEQGNWITSANTYKYYYNPKGNLYLFHYKGNIEEIIFEYEYDNMKSPFASLNLPMSPYTFPVFKNGQSINNVIKIKQTLIKSIGIQSDTTINNTEINSNYKDGYPIESDGMVFYQYIDL